MLTRVERNKRYRKSKMRFRLFILIIIIIVFISIVHINNLYNELLGSSKDNQIFSIQKEKGRMDITLLGKQIEISNNCILQGKDFFKDIKSQVFYWITDLIEK